MQTEQDLEKLVRTYTPALLRYCTGILGSEHDAQDAVQQTFIKAWQRRHTLREGENNIRAWLYRIAYRTALDMLRAAKRAANYPTPQPLEQDPGISDELRAALATELPRLILLDIMLPGEDGLALLRAIRSDERTKRIPIMMVTAKTTELDKVRGLDMGADDYLVKPFEIEELILRTENVLRLHGIKNSVLKVKDVTLDTDSHIVKKAGREIMLTPKEYELFSMLIRNKGIALSRFAIYDRIWGDEALNETRTLDIHIARLRKKLGLEDEISSVHKVGYILKENA